MSLIVSPGPAHYELVGGVGDGAPSYSFGAKSESSAGDDTPGPASYNHSPAHAATGTSSPRYTMRPKTDGGSTPTSARTPGPGAYTPSSHRGVAVTMAPRTEVPLADSVPGPGDYDTSKPLGSTAPRYSLTGRPGEGKDRAAVPGPGQYEIASTIGTARDPIQLRGRPASPRDTLIPAPGDYHTPTKPAGPQYSMRPKPDTTPGAPKTPGPGAYELGSTLQRAHSKTLSGKGPDGHDEKVPGPGAYETSPHHAIGKTAPQFSMRPKTGVVSPGAGATPGPGAYTPESKHGRGPSLTMSPKLATDDKGNVPGPGSYSTRTEPGTSQPAYSLTGRPATHDTAALPGPGAYDHTPTIGARSRDVIAPSLKGRHDGTKDEQTPAPGAYHSPARSSGPQYTMRPKPDASTLGLKTPGPGAYAIASTLSPAHAKTLSGKGPDGHDEKVPGPGAYETSPHHAIGKAAPQFSMRPKTGVVSPGAGATPGPGAYTPESKHGRGPSLTMSPKVGYDMHENVPGPGSYSTRAEPGTSQPAYSLTGRPATHDTAALPGPGAYDHTPTIGARSRDVIAPSLKGRHSVKDEKEVPGPGAYASDSPVGRRAAPAYTMRPRTTNTNSRIMPPGPGAYELKSDLGKTGAKTMSSRHATKDDSFAPGPGAYNAHAAIATGRGGAPAYSLTGRGTVPTRAANPGPGAYSPTKDGGALPSAPRYSLTGRTPMAQGDQTPGPDYSPTHPGVQKAPAYSMTGRPKSTSHDGTPGPGEYQSPLGRGLAASLSSRHAITERHVTPGPGAYDSHVAHATGKHAPKHTMAPRHQTGAGSTVFASSTNPMNHIK